MSIAWSPDAQILAAGCEDNALRFWRLPAGSDSLMGGYTSKPKVIAWNRKSDALATAGGPDVVVWSFRSGGPEGTTPLQLRAHGQPVTALAWSPDDKLLATGAGDGLVCVWSAGSEDAPLARLEIGGTVEQLAFSDDGVWLAAASSSGTPVSSPADRCGGAGAERRTRARDHGMQALPKGSSNVPGTLKRVRST